jgi:hypothetical protein
MAEIVEIPFSKIRGTREWREEQEKLRAAWEVIEGKLAEMGIKPVAIEGEAQMVRLGPGGEMAGEDAWEGSGGRLGAARLLRVLRQTRLMQLVEERGQVSRVMRQERRADGRRCRYPAEEGGAMCRAHAEWRAGPLAALPFPDDALGLQRLMAKLLSGLLYGGMDPQKALVEADVCRPMRQNIEGCERSARQAEEEFFL